VLTSGKSWAIDPCSHAADGYEGVEITVDLTQSRCSIPFLNAMYIAIEFLLLLFGGLQVRRMKFIPGASVNS
jgi:hypothetical protein